MAVSWRATRSCARPARAWRRKAVRDKRPRHARRAIEPSWCLLVKAITSSLLAVVGRLDAALPSAEHLHELVPGSHLEVLAGNAHNEY